MTDVQRTGSPAAPAVPGGLTIFGASVRAAAQSAQRAGFRPFAADLFADTDLQACCECVRLSDYPDELAQVLRRSPGYPWMYSGGLENHPLLVARMETLRPLYGNGAAVLLRVRDPWQVAGARSMERGCQPRRWPPAPKGLLSTAPGCARVGVRPADCKFRPGLATTRQSLEHRPIARRSITFSSESRGRLAPRFMWRLAGEHAWWG